MAILISAGWLFVKLLCLGIAYFGLKWVIDYLGVAVPDMIWKLITAIFVIIGAIFVLVWIATL